MVGATGVNSKLAMICLGPVELRWYDQARSADLPRLIRRRAASAAIDAIQAGVNGLFNEGW